MTSVFNFRKICSKIIKQRGLYIKFVSAIRVARFVRVVIALAILSVERDVHARLEIDN